MSRSTVVCVVFGVDSIDLDWIPTDTPVVIVHNDDRLGSAACDHPLVRHVRPGENLGFGAGINRALVEVETERVILCNPDTVLGRHHFAALDDAAPDTIVAVPLVEADGTPNAVVNPYWTVPAFLVTAFRLGRFVPRGGRSRTIAARLLGRNGAAHLDALEQLPGRFSLTERWVSGAVLSVPADCLRAVGGFDESYFLYYEDADLQQRLARVRPDLRVELAEVDPGVHVVGGSSDGPSCAVVAGHRRDSARIYASRQSGIGWRFAEAALAVSR